MDEIKGNDYINECVNKENANNGPSILRYNQEDADFYGRCVVGISKNGETVTEVLNGDYRHVDATMKISKMFGGYVVDTTSEYVAGVNAAESGDIIIQYAGTFVVIYLPAKLTEMQYITLCSTLKDHENYIFGMYYYGDIYDNLNLDKLMSYIEKINKKSRKP